MAALAANVIDISRGLDAIESELQLIRSEMVAAERLLVDRWRVPDHRRPSARNLLHYLALRRRDLRQLQGALAGYGLSSLGRAEPHALANVDRVLAVIACLRGGPAAAPRRRWNAGFSAGARLLEAQTRALLGPAPPGRDGRIMVTMPGEAAENPELIRRLLASGMNCMRINAAHDDARSWDRMLQHLDTARRATGQSCLVLIDVAGPKLRTGSIEPAAPVLRWRPARDRYGRVLAPARVWLTRREQPHDAPEPAQATLPVAGTWLAGLRPGDVIKFFDARGSMRALTVTASREDGVWCESGQTSYVVPGTTLHITRGRTHGATDVGDLPAVPQTIDLAAGDTLVLTAGLEPGRPAVRSSAGDVIEPASIGLTLPEVFADVRAGEPIWLDDGRIGGVIRDVSSSRIEMAVTWTKPGGTSLGPDKGVNLPESTLRLEPLTAKDREDLTFIDGRADLVGYSFVRTASDVEVMQAHLNAIGAGDLGIVLKIETRKAFEQLPSLLLAAMRSPSAGVMIARGDLAVECGYERLAEVQEEILWMAEASHTPVIWATQVLENLAKVGVPSRAEITDAAMAERAECVMLNKGPFIVEAVRTLDDILTRMERHQHKKSAMLRELQVAGRFLAT